MIYFRDVQTVTSAMAAESINFESGNPVTQLLTSIETVHIREDLLDEKVLSCFVEITPHAVEYTLGFHDTTDRLPDSETLSISTMCGHGMVSSHFARKMMDRVKEGQVKTGE